MGSPISLGQVSEHQYEDKSDSEILNDIRVMISEIADAYFNEYDTKREDLIVIDAHLGEVCRILEGKK